VIKYQHTHPKPGNQPQTGILFKTNFKLQEFYSQSPSAPSSTSALAQVPTCIRVVCHRIPTRTSMRLCVLLRSARQIAIGNNTLTIRTFLFSPPLSAQAHACTANFCVCFFYRPTERPRRTSLPLECHRNATNRTHSVSSARHSTSR